MVRFGSLRLRSVKEVQRFIKLLEEKDPEPKRAAVAKLAEKPDAGNFPLFARAMRDADSIVRKNATRGLAELKDPRAYSHLASALRESDAETRAAAASGLGELREPKALGALMKTASTDDDTRVRTASIGAIGKLGPNGAPAVIKLFQMLPDESVGAAAARALVQIGRSLPKSASGGHEAALAEVAARAREGMDPLALKAAMESAIGGGAAAEEAPTPKQVPKQLAKKEAVAVAPTLPSAKPAARGVRFSGEEEKLLREAHQNKMGSTFAARLISEKLGRRGPHWVIHAWKELGLTSHHKFAEGRPPVPLSAEDERVLREAHSLGYSPLRAKRHFNEKTGAKHTEFWVRANWKRLGLQPNPVRMPKGRPTFAVTPEQIGKLREAHGRLMTAVDAAKFAGVNRLTAVKHWRKAGLEAYSKAGLTLARARRAEEQWRAAPEAQRGPQLVKKIAEGFGASLSATERYLRSAGITKLKGQPVLRTTKLKSDVPREVLEELRPSLSKSAVRILTERGYFGGEVRPLLEVANRLGVTRQNVHAVESSALRKGRALMESRRRPE